MTNLFNKIITGERIQQLAEIYIGYGEDFDYNPLIKIQKNKQKLITSIIEPFNNPYIIFIYTNIT